MLKDMRQRPRDRRPRTAFLTAAVGAVGLLAVACSPAPGDAGGAGGANAVSVDGRYGTVSAPGDPERVAALGLGELGFTLPADLRDLIGDRFYADVSAEKTRMLDLDALVVLDHAGARGSLADDPLFQGLDVVKRGDAVFVDDMIGDAMSMPDPLTIPYVLDNLVPQLAQTPDPAQTPAPAPAAASPN